MYHSQYQSWCWGSRGPQVWWGWLQPRCCHSTSPPSSPAVSQTLHHPSELCYLNQSQISIVSTNQRRVLLITIASLNSERAFGLLAVTPVIILTILIINYFYLSPVLLILALRPWRWWNLRSEHVSSVWLNKVALVALLSRPSGDLQSLIKLN